MCNNILQHTKCDTVGVPNSTIVWGESRMLTRQHSSLLRRTCIWYIVLGWKRQGVPKRWHVKFRRRGITKKKTYNIHNMAKVYINNLVSYWLSKHKSWRCVTRRLTSWINYNSTQVVCFIIIIIIIIIAAAAAAIQLPLGGSSPYTSTDGCHSVAAVLTPVQTAVTRWQ
jgi:hypothetical protein